MVSYNLLEKHLNKTDIIEPVKSNTMSVPRMEVTNGFPCGGDDNMRILKDVQDHCHILWIDR